jgi:1-acyl-sn-glycerol-3-phosphate acyltransferase
MRVLNLPLKWLYSIYAFVTFVAIMLLVFPVAVLSSFFGRIKGGNMIYRLCMVWADLWFPMVFIRHKRIFEAPHDKNKSYIFVSNHISYLDAAIIPKAFRQPIRPLGKVEMSKVPIFGFIYRKVIVTVDRSSPANRAKSMMILKSLINKGISVLVFPEGTFNMGATPLKEFYDGAFRLAIETQTPIRPVLFLDAYRRMPSQGLFQMTPGISRIVYLHEIPVENYKTDDVFALKQNVYNIMESKLLQYNSARRKA